MSQFDECFARLLDAAESDMAAAFRVRRDAMIEGRWVALEASFHVESERKMLGLIPMGGTSRCQENCLFIPTKELTGDTFSQLTAYAERVHAALIRPDATHEFSMISLVLVTENASPEIKKAIKKYSFERRYSAPESGWSTIRLAVIDLPSGKVHCNQSGTALSDRLRPTIKKCL